MATSLTSFNSTSSTPHGRAQAHRDEGAGHAAGEGLVGLHGGHTTEQFELLEQTVMSQETAIRTVRGDNVQADDVYVLFSSVPRTTESVLCLLRGFFEQQNVP
uniref:Uncharacterized protein n=1 Tax=Phytophthora ramorum TaxID=164328 RepID=H3GRI3_PHYRM